MSTLYLQQATYEAIRAHSEEAYPAECCGVLLGQRAGGEAHVIESVKTSNASTGAPHNRYSIAPIELIRIERDARHRGMEIIGFYHSHPDHPAYWSATDMADAHWLGCSYVITSVFAGSATATNSFLLTGATEEHKRFEPEKIDLIHEAL